MHSIRQLQQLVNQALLKKQVNSAGALDEPIQYLLRSGGKRIRPSLLLMGCDLFQGSILKAMQAAMAIEFFHNFTLMHDDIMDQAPLRRGFQSVHEKWNVNTAILAGDALLIEAYTLLMHVEDPLLRAVLSIFNAMSLSVFHGQQLDLQFEDVTIVTTQNYLAMIRLKTAALLAASLKIGSLIGGAPPDQADLMHTLGESLGMGFQIQDDLLDVYGQASEVGKVIGGDILANKKTFLLVTALELAEGNDKQELMYWLSQGNLDEPGKLSKIQSVIAIYNRLGVRSLAETEVNAFTENALRTLSDVAVDKSRKQVLREFAEQLFIRTN